MTIGTFDAIASYYEIADEIILGLDESRLTWAGEPFQIDMDEVRAFIHQLDRARSINLVEANFHSFAHPMDNDTHERNVLSKHCKAGHWIVQIDADEILLNAQEFVAWMEQNDTNLGDYSVGARWITVFKQFGEQALVVSPATEMTPIATRLRGEFLIARNTSKLLAASPLRLLHFSWGRSSAELTQKLRNWSHARDFDVDNFYQRWAGLTLENYQQWQDFHPVIPATWKKLEIVKLVRNGMRL